MRHLRALAASGDTAADFELNVIYFRHHILLFIYSVILYICTHTHTHMSLLYRTLSNNHHPRGWRTHELNLHTSQIIISIETVRFLV